MDAQDFRSLQEAYLNVYEQEESLDEAIYSEKGKAKAAEMIAKRSTPSGRAKSGKGANVAQIRQIRGSGRGRFDREGLGGTPMTPTMAKNPIKKQNYDGTGNKAARRAGTYSRFGYKESYDLYDIIFSHLINEGYADTKEAAERIMVNMSEEWKETILEITGGKGHPGYKAGSRDLGPMQSGHPADSSKRTMKGGTMSMRHGDHLGDLDDNDDDDDDGLEAGLKDSAKKSRENVRKPLRNMVKTAAKRLNKESYDLYDVILSHLIDEGYADTEEAAERIMVNMSEEWRESIVETRMDPRGRPASGPMNVYENEQLDELSVNKMHDYINKAEKDRARLNKKWDQGTATSKERKKVFDREEGEARASKKIRQKTGKDSFRLNALDKLKSAITKESYDIFDAILEHLIAEGYADTNESALVIMANMSEEWRNSIVEVKLDPRGRIASGPMNVYANPKGKPSQARLDAIKAYDAEEKKKTPEQRAQELADYKERQMNR